MTVAKSYFSTVLCMLGGVFSGNATDVVPDVADSVMQLHEVSVTAIKQGVADASPAAVTIVGAQEVERLNIVTMKQVSEIAPNFYVPDYGSRMTSSVYVRGLGARIDQPVVGLNVDNVPILNKDNYDFDLVDIARIEVLRGPQSTLYGRNTMGGLINVYTLSPMNYSGVRASAEYSSGKTWKVSAGVYRRLRPRLGMSVTASMMSSDGFFKNLNDGKKIDWEKQGALRWRTAWRSESGLVLDNVAAVTVTRQGGYP
ncbi:MAG: TonB-dependent receptor plug domain-containing protein, partial [Muribaculaceae bacterium]|nr:TonB-dependent receptor plug domain-containing protein [Muribaculaceae bacterium]